MKPIINPWLVYIAEKCESISDICACMGFFGIIALVIWGVCYLVGDSSKVPKWLVAITVSCLVISTLLPTQKTVLTMATLKYITPNNVEIIGDTATDVVDYITDKIEEIMDEED